MKCDNCANKDYFDTCKLPHCANCPCYLNNCCEAGMRMVEIMIKKAERNEGE